MYVYDLGKLGGAHLLCTEGRIGLIHINISILEMGKLDR
jgi:hypothetical protein